jgi:hypothetical protein
MRDLDRTTTQPQWRDIIARRTALLVEAAQRVGDAISAGKRPDEIQALRRQAIEALIRLCEASPQDIRGESDYRNELDQIIFEAEQIWIRK